MTHRTTLALLAAASLLTVACGSGDGDDPAAASTSIAAATAAPPTAAPPTSLPATVAPATTPPTTPPATSPPPTTVPPTAPPTSAPAEPFELVGLGAHPVGVSTVVVGEGGERPLTVDVWFPMLPAAAETAPPHRYTFIPGVYYESPVAMSGEPTSVSPNGPFPLVVYSHGSTGLRYVHAAYTEILASHGYVVVAPDHTGNTAVDLIAGTTASASQIAFDRPNDVKRLIDAFTGVGDEAGPATGWSTAVDADRIAVTGHSFGGYTSIALVAGAETELGTVSPDDRVGAIIPLAPAVGDSWFPDEMLAAIDTPMMIVGATSDDRTPIDPNVTRLWNLSAHSPAYRVDLIDAEHETFTDLCAYLRFFPTIADAVPELLLDLVVDEVGDACMPDAMDDVRATELTASYAVAFLDEVLRDGDPIIGTPPDDVIFAAR